MLPCNLQVLTLGVGHSLRLGGVVLPNSLKTVTLPNVLLQRLSFGRRFRRSLGGVMLPSGLQPSPSGYGFCHRSQGNMPSSRLQPLILCDRFSHFVW